jgi:ABC-type spermidine/putrescine transport system permease subunit II
LIFAVGETVTWIHVEKPTFDLIGVVLGSLALAGLLVLVAVLMGLLFALLLIRRDRTLRPPALDAVSLHLDRPTPSSSL